MKPIHFAMLGALAIGGYIFFSGASAPSAPTLLIGDKEQHRPSATLNIKRSPGMTSWQAPGDEIIAWCFYRAANVARVGDEFWAINGVARTIAKNGGRIRFEGVERALLDGWAGSVARTEFAATMNDRMNEACP